MPASGRLSVVSAGAVSAGTDMMTVRGRVTRTIKSRLLAAGERQVFTHVERGVLVTPQSGFEVHVDTGLGKWRKISTG